MRVRLYLQVRLCSLLIARLIRLQFVQLLQLSILLRHRLIQLKLTYQNNKKLYDSKIIGEYELSTAANSYATAKAQVAQAEAALASAREQLTWCTVTSPSAGVVGSLPFKVGALVSASGQALTTVSTSAPWRYSFSLSESQILSMSKTNGSVQAAIAAFPAVKLQLADGSIYNHPGKVVKMSGVIDATSGSISSSLLTSLTQRSC